MAKKVKKMVSSPVHLEKYGKVGKIKSLKGFDDQKQVRYLALTKFNADFIETVVRDLDSSYKRAGSNTAAKTTKYRGSSAYWFDQIQHPSAGYNFDVCLLNAISAVDAENSTHLNTCINGRQTMRNIISKSCGGTLNGLKKALAQDISVMRGNHIFGEMVAPMNLTGKSKKGSTRRNPSFASKFLFYACKYLKVNPVFEYCKYDSVVSDELKVYYDLYLPKAKRFPKKKLKIDTHAPNTNDIVDAYIFYCEKIHEIIKSPYVSGQSIDVEKFDWIVWYSNKGK